MPDADSRKRVLDMLAAGTISAEDAAKLLAAIGGEPPPGTAPAAPRPRGTARSLRVSIDAREGEDAGKDRARIRVNVPLGLARFASRFLPPEAKRELEAQGIDLVELLAGLGDEVPEGPLVDIDIDDDEGGSKRAKILIEVV
jgi:hypothetical protein